PPRSLASTNILPTQPTITRSLTLSHLSFSILTRRPPTSTLFPYTTLFRSCSSSCSFRQDDVVDEAGAADADGAGEDGRVELGSTDRKSTRLNSSHRTISYAGFCLKKKK